MLIHRAMEESGKIEDFSFEILEYCDPNILDEREQYYIALLNSKFPNGYNLTDGGKTYSHIKGEDHFKHILTQNQVDIIYEMLLNGKNSKEIKQVVPSASIMTISAINTGRNWRKEGYTYPLSRFNGTIKVSDNQVKEIRELWANNKTINEISELYPNISKTTVSDIILGKTHKNIPITYNHFPDKKHSFSEEEVNLYRQMHFIQNKTINEIYDYYCNISISEKRISLGSFREMINGQSYKQFKVYSKKQIPFEETLKGQEEMRRKNKINRNEKIKELFLKNISKQEIAKIVGCSVRTVYRVLEK